MTRHLKSTLMVLAGLSCLGFAAVFGLCLVGYLTGGAGLQVFGFFFAPSPTTLLVGLVHFTGFVAAAVACFIIGVGLCAYGFVPAQRPPSPTEPKPEKY